MATMTYAREAKIPDDFNGVIMRHGDGTTTEVWSHANGVKIWEQSPTGQVPYIVTEAEVSTETR